MSWDVYLKDENGDCVKIEAHSEGGTYVLGGTDDAELNVTYNYSKHFFDAMGISFSDLNGMKSSDAILYLEKGVEKLGTQRDVDYWKASEGNSGYALSILLKWAKQYPNATFEVS